MAPTTTKCPHIYWWQAAETKKAEEAALLAKSEQILASLVSECSAQCWHGCYS